MISNTFVLLFAICRDVSMTPTIGMLGWLLFWVVIHSRFLRQVLCSTHGFHLLLFLRHQLHQKTLISRWIDPFCWWQKRGEILMELNLGDKSYILGVFTFWTVYFWFSVFEYVFGNVLCFMDIYFVWYVSGFEVGMNLYTCMDIFLIWYLSLLSLHTWCMWHMCIVYCFLYNPTICHLYWTLEVI